MEYEVFYLVVDSKKKDLDKIRGEVKKVIEGAGGSYTGDDHVEERKLAFEIEKQYRGVYVAERFTTADKDAREDKPGDDGLATDLIGEMTKQMNLVADVSRFLIVKADELPPLGKHKEKLEAQEKEEKKMIKTSGEAIDEKLEQALKLDK